MSTKTGSVARKYTKSASLPPCKLKKDDLVKLAEIIRQSVNPSSMKDYFYIRTDLPHVSLSAENIYGFLQNEELPDEIIDLSIYCFRYSEVPHISKEIQLSLHNWLSSISVTGEDENWVLGTYAKITRFFKGKRPWFWFGANYYVFSYVSAFIGIACVFAFIWLVATSGAPIAYSISVALFFIAILFAAYLHFKGKFMPCVQIILRPKQSFLNYNLLINLVIAILTAASLIVSIIQATN